MSPTAPGAPPPAPPTRRKAPTFAAMLVRAQRRFAAATRPLPPRPATA